MARVEYRDAADLSPAERRMLDPRPINLFRALANCPGGAALLYDVGQWIRHDGQLDPRLRELAILQIGWCTANEYEWTHHIRLGRDFGVTDVDVAAIAAGPDASELHFPDVEWLALRAAIELIEGGEVAAATFDALTSRLGVEQAVELLIVLAFYSAVARILVSLDVDNEAEFAAELDRFPLGSRREDA